MIMSDNSLDNLNNTANSEAKIIDKWLTSDKLALNTSKTGFMLFSTEKMSANKFSLTIRGEKINRTPVAKYLGLLIDEKLKFDVHVKHVCKKLSQICGIFCYLRHYICKKTLLMLYYSLVNSHILYGILVWDSTNHSILQQLQVLQSKIMRIICNVRKNELVKNNTLYHELKLLKVKDIYHLEMAKFMYLFHHNKLPNRFNQYFTSTKTVQKYNTRCTSYNNFYLLAINSNAAKKALQFSGAQMWNSLQPNWKDLSFSKFKEAVKADLILKYK